MAPKKALLIILLLFVFLFSIFGFVYYVKNKPQSEPNKNFQLNTKSLEEKPLTPEQKEEKMIEILDQTASNTPAMKETPASIKAKRQQMMDILK